MDASDTTRGSGNASTDSELPETLTDGDTTTADTDDVVDYPTTAVAFPVTVPPQIERSVRQRMNEHGDDDLGKYLHDHYDLEPQWLTRDVDHEEWGEPATHSLYSLVPESVYRDVVAAADESPQQWVRDAVVLRLEMDNGGEPVGDA